MTMQFWGVEVKPGTPVTCNPDEGKYIHLSQACIGESKVKEKIVLSVKVGDKKLVIGSLSSDTCAQIAYDLVFEKEFELSHSSKNASVSFCGYKTCPPGEESDEDDPESEEDEPIPLNTNEGKSVAKQDQVKPSNGKAKAAKAEKSADKQAKPAKVDKSDAKGEDSDFSDSSSSDPADSSSDSSDSSSESDEDMPEALSDSDVEAEEEDDTPKKPATLKRPAESSSKTPVREKKAKIVTPAGAKAGGEGKKSVRVATPHPAKKAGKTPASNSDKAKQQTPKSAGSVACKSCSKKFVSDSALQAHTKAKHA